MSKSIPFEINQVYREEIAHLLSSRKKSKIIHSSGDIDASGDEVETPFRDLLKRRLPNQYFVGHGKIVDKFLNVSPQFDVIISDNNATPILFETKNGAQFFPWESVYAVGEIKTRYDKKKRPIAKFAENVQQLKTRLSRLPTPSNYLGNGVTLGKGFSTSDKRQLRNPLFAFIVFFDSGSATRDDLADEYGVTRDEHLPAMSLFLDGKVIVKAELKKVTGGVAMGAVELNPLRITERNDIDWMYVSYQSQNDAGAQALVVLMLGLFGHLNSCVLMPPRIGDYLNTVLHSATNQPLPLTIGAVVTLLKLSGKRLPDAAIKILEFRAKRGKSPFRKFTAKDMKEMAAFVKESGIDIDSLPKFITSLKQN